MENRKKVEPFEIDEKDVSVGGQLTGFPSPEVRAILVNLSKKSLTERSSTTDLLAEAKYIDSEDLKVLNDFASKLNKESDCEVLSIGSCGSCEGRCQGRGREGEFHQWLGHALMVRCSGGEIKEQCWSGCLFVVC